MANTQAGRLNGLSTAGDVGMSVCVAVGKKSSYLHN